jgi:hypothetical protein
MKEITSFGFRLGITNYWNYSQVFLDYRYNFKFIFFLEKRINLIFKYLPKLFIYLFKIIYKKKLFEKKKQQIYFELLFSLVFLKNISLLSFFYQKKDYIFSMIQNFTKQNLFAGHHINLCLLSKFFLINYKTYLIQNKIYCDVNYISLMNKLYFLKFNYFLYKYRFLTNKKKLKKKKFKIIFLKKLFFNLYINFFFKKYQNVNSYFLFKKLRKKLNLNKNKLFLLKSFILNRKSKLFLKKKYRHNIKLRIFKNKKNKFLFRKKLLKTNNYIPVAIKEKYRKRLLNNFTYIVTIREKKCTYLQYFFSKKIKFIKTTNKFKNFIKKKKNKQFYFHKRRNTLYAIMDRKILLSKSFFEIIKLKRFVRKKKIKKKYIIFSLKKLLKKRIKKINFFLKKRKKKYNKKKIKPLFFFLHSSKIQHFSLFFYKKTLETLLTSLFKIPVFLYFKNLHHYLFFDRFYQTIYSQYKRNYNFILKKQPYNLLLFNVLYLALLNRKCSLIANYIGLLLEKAKKHNKILNNTFNLICNYLKVTNNYSGIKLIIRGKFNGNTRARMRKLIWGHALPTQELYQIVDYGYFPVITYTGIFGIHIWFYFLKNKSVKIDEIIYKSRIKKKRTLKKKKIRYQKLKNKYKKLQFKEKFNFIKKKVNV